MNDRTSTHLEPFTHCPNCDSRVFKWGPRGGVAINIECWYCEAVYNIGMMPGGPYLLETIKPGLPNMLRDEEKPR